MGDRLAGLLPSRFKGIGAPGARASGRICAMATESSSIPRHRTALTRTALSKPIRQALADNIITPNATVLDYGCGRGSDVKRLQAAGHIAEGWDPKHAPEGRLTPAQIVNLGYVVNRSEE